MNRYSKLQRVKELVIKQLLGAITPQETDELTLLGRDDQCQRLINDLLSSDFLSHAISDQNKTAMEKSWRSIYNQLNYTGGIFRFRKQIRLIAAAAAILILAVGIYTGWEKKHHESIIQPGITQAKITWPDGKQSTYTTDMLGGNISFTFSPGQTVLTGNSPALSPDLYTRIIVSTGSEYKLCLDDGTRIHLNAGATLTIPTDFSPNNRQINLTGEAYLEVSKDSLHPFLIGTDKAEIRVLGTELNIRCYEDEPELKVTLTKGRVDIHSAIGDYSLPVGHQAIIDGQGNTNIIPTDLYSATAWHQGRFVFEDQSIEKIMNELCRWYGIQVSFSSDEVRQMRFTLDTDRYATFNHFADIMRLTGEVDIHIRNGQVLIGKRNDRQSK